jgi:hypothetical protein
LPGGTVAGSKKPVLDFAVRAAGLAPIYVLPASNELSYSTGQVYGAVGGRCGP